VINQIIALAANSNDPIWPDSPFNAVKVAVIEVSVSGFVNMF
jgi:hypothetical protein